MNVEKNINAFSGIDKKLIDLAQFVPNKDYFDSVKYLREVSDIMESYDHFLDVDDNNEKKYTALAIEEMIDRATR